MIHFLLTMLVCFVASLATAFAQTNVFQDPGRRVALVVGISTYDHVQTLRNPGNDAKVIAQALAKLEFDVLHIVDPTRNELVDARDNFLRRLAGADIAFLYYAGHAIQVDGANYLVPRDTALMASDAIGTELVSLASLVNSMDQGAKTKIVVLDACRDNPFETKLAAAIAHEPGERKLGRGLAPVRETKPLAKPDGEGFNTYGSVIAFSAAPGTTATDGDGDNSPYTAALAAELARPGVEVGQMFRVAAANVVRETNGAQRPEYLVRLTDEVYFSRPQPSDCDYFAVAPYNQVGIPGVEFDAIRPAKAIVACTEALAAEPDHPRLLHNLGRAYDAAADYDKAVAYYRRAADLGYTAAISTLGVMHINGQGTKQDFEEGVRLLKLAAAQGYRLAKVGLRNQDFTKIFKAEQFKAIQRSLKEEGYYDGPLDGDFGSGSKAALEKYQIAKGLIANGGTLETLDSLGLISIIPNYQLN